MAEQSGAPKPGDLFIGVIDFFAILVPGVLTTILVAWHAGAIPEKPETFFFVELLVAGFILGHVLHGVGSFLDPLLYDPLFKPNFTLGKRLSALKYLVSALKYFRAKKYFRKNDQLYRRAERFASFDDKIDGDHDDLPKAAADTNNGKAEIGKPPGGMYQWARAWLRLHSPEATAELDRLEADSKLFRSLSVLTLALVMGWNYIPHWTGELPLTVGAIVFSCWRYCDLRQKMVRSCYLHYVQLRSEGEQAVFHRAKLRRRIVGTSGTKRNRTN